MTRNPAYDIMRCVAIFLVATQHAWSMLGMDTPEYGLLCHAYRAIVDCGVPLFVAISGALLLQEKPQPLAVFFRRRFSRVLIPFLLWATVVYIMSVVTNQYNDIQNMGDALRCFVPYLFANRINTSHWFVWMILALYMLTPVLQRMLQAEDGRRVVEYLLVLVVVALFGQWLFPEVYILRYASPLLAYLGVYLGGYYIARYVDRPCLWALTGLVSVGLCLLPGAPVHLLTKLTALALFAAMKPLHGLPLESPGTKTAIALSRYSYMVYLVHIPLIRAMLIVFKPETATMMPVGIGMVAVLMAALACWAVDKVLPRPLGRALGIA